MMQATPTRRRFRRLLCALCWPALIAVPPAGAQTFEERTEVVEVQVPVTVTSRDGTPVRGLPAESFSIFDNGKKQRVTGMRVIDLAQLEAPRAGRVAPLVRALPSAARRHFLLLFDLSFSDPASVLRAQEAARRFVLEDLHPTDLAAVATFSLERGPQLLVTFTPDRAQLARAIDVLALQGSLADRRGADPLRFLIDTPSPATATGIDSSTATRTAARVLGEGPTGGQDPMTAARAILATRFDRSQKTFERQQIADWSQALGSLARALDAVRGRKHVLYFSEGFDSRLYLGREPDSESQAALTDTLRVVQGQSFWVDSDDLFGNTGLQGDINTMLREFRRADCVIQAVDIGGLRAGADVRDTVGNRGQEALFYLANETGGELFKDANDLSDQLDRMLERNSVTYLLSFQPEDLELDGSYHRLKVKVDAPGRTRVSHRDGYYAPRPFVELHPLEKNLLASDAIASAVPRQDLEVDVLAVPFKASATAAYVPVILEVAGESLLVGNEGDELPVEIYAYVTNERGEMRDYFSQLVQLDVGDRRRRRALSGSGLKYYGHLLLTPGDHLVRVLVRNAITGRTGVATTSLMVPEFSDAEPVLLPPFFLEEPGRWVLVRGSREESQGGTVVYPFTVKGEPYIPAARPALGRGTEADVCLVAYNLGAGSLELSGRIYGSDGERVDGGKLALKERTVTGISGLDKLLVTFEPQGLGQGDYTLEVAVTDPVTRATQANRIPFSVRN